MCRNRTQGGTVWGLVEGGSGMQHVLGSLKKGTEMQLTSLMDLESRSCWSDEHRHIELKLQLERWRQEPNIAQVVRSVVHISSDISVNKMFN